MTNGKVVGQHKGSSVGGGGCTCGQKTGGFLYLGVCRQSENYKMEKIKGR